MRTKLVNSCVIPPACALYVGVESYFHILGAVLLVGACVFPRLLEFHWKPDTDTVSPMLRYWNSLVIYLRSIGTLCRELESLSITGKGSVAHTAYELSLLSETVLSCK
ncbi:hypothetical protein K503DRAFT_769908 [Rhizopogon vinicolor AM-OR11-026]|uniref:Uncharacterized protein n=1 Tax=Rhizopogon vinicolor AM-OR11-026 TaxID=1314800 RepID=A0A1B7N296_9AGAM|nr:hypothetical protein K503DRAFT_769908 [Rhizopogon vinicolor AM-OR11-026]